MLVVCIITGQTWWYELPSLFPVTLRAAATPDVAEGLEAAAAAAAHATTPRSADTACNCHVLSIFRWLLAPTGKVKLCRVLPQDRIYICGPGDQTSRVPDL
jgi:hypothetical protein